MKTYTKEQTTRAMSLINTLAWLRVDGDTVDGEEYYADGNDDEVDALYSAVALAREILGVPDSIDHSDN